MDPRGFARGAHRSDRGRHAASTASDRGARRRARGSAGVPSRRRHDEWDPGRRHGRRDHLLAVARLLSRAAASWPRATTTTASPRCARTSSVNCSPPSTVWPARCSGASKLMPAAARRATSPRADRGGAMGTRATRRAGRWAVCHISRYSSTDARFWWRLTRLPL